MEFGNKLDVLTASLTISTQTALDKTKDTILNTMPRGRYIVGIDLGTTHTAMACVELSDKAPFPRIRVIEIPQTIKAGLVEKRSLLPSCIYLPTEHEMLDDSLELPWARHAPRTEDGIRYTVGEFARSQGVDFPERFISSAKSWLTQPGPMLPWNAAPDTPRMSAVQASSLLLRHLSHAWDDAMGRDPRNGPLKDQQIVIGVPASFDAVARGLTLDAARLAGLTEAVLLEEPQAAFYSWIAQSRETWRTLLHAGDRVLIVDVGGGTTDFSLIAVEDQDGALGLRRIAVSEHILLGGDNMDLTLARSAAMRISGEGITLDPWQLQGLTLACREAKERLLEAPFTASKTMRAPQNIAATPRRQSALQAQTDANAPPCLYIRKKPRKPSRKELAALNAPPLANAAQEPTSQKNMPCAVLGRGANVVGRSVAASLPRDEAARAILDGFLDFCEASAKPSRYSRLGLREKGLGYSADPSITKHLAKFLSGACRELGPNEWGAHFVNKNAVVAHPSVILFNGGVLKSELLRQRVTQVLSHWLEKDGGVAPRVLTAHDPELAVARGAAYFGSVQSSGGVRIQGGVARSYYIAVESTQPAIPGQLPAIKALCVVPFGMDEGTQREVPGAEFGLIVGEAAQFRFFSSSERRGDALGQRVEIVEDSLRELAPIETTIPATLFDAPGVTVPVTLKSVITSVGTLELWFNAIGSAGAWKLELNVRDIS